jgi:hypothetical protein
MKAKHNKFWQVGVKSCLRPQGNIKQNIDFVDLPFLDPISNAMACMIVRVHSGLLCKILLKAHFSPVFLNRHDIAESGVKYPKSNQSICFSLIFPLQAYSLILQRYKT